MNKKLLKLFVETYTKGVIDFEGIKILLDYVEEDEKPVKLRIDNPEMISYTEHAILNRYFDEAADFAKLTSNSVGERGHVFAFANTILKQTETIDVENQFVSTYLSSQITSGAKKVKTLDISLSKKLKIDYTIDVDVIDWDIETHGEQINLNVDLVVLSVYDNFNHKQVDVEVLRIVFDTIYEDGTMHDLNEELCREMSRPIATTKTFYDWNDSYYVINTRFLTTSGKIIF